MVCRLLALGDHFESPIAQSESLCRVGRHAERAFELAMLPGGASLYVIL